MWITASADELKPLIDPIGNGLFVIEADDDGCFRLLGINRKIEQIAGLTHDQVSGRSIEDLFTSADATRLCERYRRCVRTARQEEYEESLELPNGRTWWRTVLTPVVDATGRVRRLVGSAIEVSERRRLEADLRRTALELRESQSRLQLAIRGAELGVWEWDVPARRLRVADEWDPHISLFQGLTDISVSDWIRLIHPDDRGRAIAGGDSAVAGKTKSYRTEYRVRTRHGEWTWVESHGTVVEEDEQGNPLRVCGTYRDINQQKRDREELRKLTEELRYRATHDSLTGALDHGAILEALDKELVRARRERGVVTVALVDADYFKEINDQHGHQTGDEVLEALVSRIRQVLRPYDHLGRYGGEEFLVVTPGMSDGVDLHERIRAAVAQEPFHTRAGPLEITVSVGAAASSSVDATREHLLAAADHALYRAKNGGRNRALRADEQDSEERVD